jgi:hypothetical protein
MTKAHTESIHSSLDIDGLPRGRIDQQEVVLLLQLLPERNGILSRINGSIIVPYDATLRRRERSCGRSQRRASRGVVDVADRVARHNQSHFVIVGQEREKARIRSKNDEQGDETGLFGQVLPSYFNEQLQYF